MLLQVVFHAQIAAEEARFDIDDVARGIIAKIRHRHPHIFGDAPRPARPTRSSRNWDSIKHAEKPSAATARSTASRTRCPALMLAQKISRRAVAVGFEWETLDDVWDKVHEEIEELQGDRAGSRRGRRRDRRRAVHRGESRAQAGHGRRDGAAADVREVPRRCADMEAGRASVRSRAAIDEMELSASGELESAVAAGRSA